MIRLLGNEEAVNFLKKYYNEPVPDGIKVTTEHSFVVGIFDKELVACFPCTDFGELRFHACIKPEYRGKAGLQMCKDVLQWIFNSTTYDRITAYIEPKHARHCAVMAGFKRVGDLYEIRR